MARPLTADHPNSSIALDAAVCWLKETPREARPGAAIPQLRARFGLSAAEACRALAEHHLNMARSS